MKIYLFLPDFRGLVKGTVFVSGNVNHSVFYYEEWYYGIDNLR